MLNIKNIEKIMEIAWCSVQIKQVQMTDREHPQRTYDVVFEHVEKPNREFFLTLDREGTYNDTVGYIEYPISFWELTGPHNKSTDVTVWESNLESPTDFLDFIDILIQQYTT